MPVASPLVSRIDGRHRRRPGHARLAAALCAGIGLLLQVAPLAAAPFVPKSDAEVVEQLPSRIASPNDRREQRQLREQLRSNPQQLPLALQAAREAIGRARTLGDPREYGQAEAALASWWSLPDPPPPVRLLRAIVRQAQHEFGAALVDLDALLGEPAAAAGPGAAPPGSGVVAGAAGGSAAPATAAGARATAGAGGSAGSAGGAVPSASGGAAVTAAVERTSPATGASIGATAGGTAATAAVERGAASRLPAAAVPLPLRAQAELTRASVLQVTGRWAEAAAGCERLGGARYAALGVAVRIPSRACLAELSSLQGWAAQAAQTLAALAREDAAQGGGDAVWLALLRAELAERRGDDAAHALYRQALQLQREATPERPPDVYTLAAYADWLLARGRNREVAELLAGREDADALLLRLAIAWKAAHDPRAAGAIATLTARFDAAAQRGDTSHGREQSRYELELMNNPAAALKHAQLNWASQREPGDALTLLRAARAAGDARAAEPVWQMVRDTGWEDVRLAAAANRATAAASDGGAKPVTGK